VAGLATVLGSGAMTNTIGEVENAQAIFVIGSNTTENHPIIGYRIRKAVRNGAKLIVADPRSIPLTEICDVYLPLKPGADVALINGMLHVILKEGLVDNEFIANRTEGFEDMKATVDKYTPEYASQLSGVPAEDIIKAARLYAGADSATVLYTMGVTQHTSGTENVLSLANLTLATGNFGKPGAGLNPLRGQNNVQGACDMGALPVVFTGYQPVADPTVREKFENAWNVRLPDKPGMTMTEMFQAAGEDRIRALYIMGENPFLSDPDGSHICHTLEKMDFLVVQDIFLTETAQLADVVLPAATFAEKNGVFANTERRVQRVRKALNPRGQSKPDWEIITMLARKLGFDWNYENSEQVMEEISRLTPSYAGINYQRLEDGGIQWPCPDTEHPGTPILHVGKFSRGLGKFSAVEYRLSAEQADGEYPFLLTTGRSLYHYHTGTMTRKTEGLNQFHSEELMEINPLDAEKLGIGPNDSVIVSSRRGSVRCNVRLTERVQRGVVFMTFHFAESAANLLTNSEFCRIAKTPELKVCAVRLEKAE
jgi:formate dehydrogenase alpha subunit